MTLVYTEMRHELAKGYDNKFWFMTDDNIDADTQWLVDSAGAQKAETVEELAAIIGAETDAVQATIDAYNASAGTDNDAFGKPAAYNKGPQAPCTVIPDEPMRTTTIGGLKITTDAEVIGTNGSRAVRRWRSYQRELLLPDVHLRHRIRRRDHLWPHGGHERRRGCAG